MPQWAVSGLHDCLWNGWGVRSEVSSTNILWTWRDKGLVLQRKLGVIFFRSSGNGFWHKDIIYLPWLPYIEYLPSFDDIFSSQVSLLFYSLVWPVPSRTLLKVNVALYEKEKVACAFEGVWIPVICVSFLLSSVVTSSSYPGAAFFQYLPREERPGVKGHATATDTFTGGERP